ncbi:MAG: hypothetical protein DMF00_16735 [Verrucomicrobia bacterium]|nr:MAG: hypothetical protein DMF00_16735 [Verrucomicrobiota bacterium]
MTFKVTREGELAGRGKLVKTSENLLRRKKFPTSKHSKPAWNRKQKSSRKKAWKFTRRRKRLSFFPHF